MSEPTITLSKSEWQVMQALWRGPKKLMDLVWELGESAGWAKSTVTTMVRRMEGKGLIAYDLEGRTKTFRAVLQREDVVAAETNSLLKRAYDGSVGLLVDTLVQQQQLSRADIDELYAILEKAEEGVE